MGRVHEVEEEVRLKGESKYPWDAWARPLPEGKAWVVVRFRDYTCESTSFAGYVHRAASERGKKATCVTFDSYVVFLMYDGNSFWKPNLKAFPEVMKHAHNYAGTHVQRTT